MILYKRYIDLYFASNGQIYIIIKAYNITKSRFQEEIIYIYIKIIITYLSFETFTTYL